MNQQLTQMYRVKAVAKMLDVSVATIYRAIESGALRALKVGTGKGALRVPEDAIQEYVTTCQQAALASVPTLPEVA
ncbi:MAG: helix-turn-helix domain-containing protein [Umezawaea sp.]